MPACHFENPTYNVIMDLARELQNGKVLLPFSKHKAPWSSKKQLLLLDSILRGIPIGAIIVWQSDSPTFGLLPDLFNRYRYIIDGHQRATTLLNAFKKPTNDLDPIFGFNAKLNSFTVETQASIPTTGWLPLHAIMDDTEAMMGFFHQSKVVDEATIKNGIHFFDTFRKVTIASSPLLQVNTLPVTDLNFVRECWIRSRTDSQQGTLSIFDDSIQTEYLEDQ